MKKRKWIAGLIILVVLGLISLGSAGLAVSQGDSPPKTKPQPDRSIKGEVTAINDTELTVTSDNGQTMTALITGDTKVRRSGGGQVSLDDIKAGDSAGVLGVEDDGTIVAVVIVLIPDNRPTLTVVQGQVTAVGREMIVIQSQQGRQPIVTDDDTRINLGKQEGALADIQIGQEVMVKGSKQDSDSFVARSITVVEPEAAGKNVLQGEVAGVDQSTGVLEIEAKGDKAGTWTIKTTDQTEFRIPGVDDPTVVDVPVGALVEVVGPPDGENSRSVTARLIIVPEKKSLASRRVAGKVTGLDAAGFTLQVGPQKELTILTNESTEYRAWGDRNQTVTDEGLKVGVNVLVTGQPVDGQENTIKATTISLKLKPERKEK